MGARLHRAPEQERAVQEGRRPAPRPRPDPPRLLPAWLRLHRPRRPAWSLPVDGSLHAARPGLRRRQDRDARGGGARRRVLHDARPLGRGAALAADRAGPGHHRRRLRARHRRRHRPGEHPVPLDPHRGRARDLAAARRRRAVHARGVRRLAAAVPRLPRRRRRRGRDHRRQRCPGGDPPALHRQPRLLEPPPQVQDRAHRAPQPRRLPRDQRRVLRRYGPPRARPRLRPVGRWRPVHQPDAGPEGRRLDPGRRGRRRVGGRGLDLPRLRLPPPALPRAPEVPGRRLGRREVPRGAGERVPPPPAGLLRLPRIPGRAPGPHRRAPPARRSALRRDRSDRGPGVGHHAGHAWPS